MTKKAIILLLVIALLSTTFAGCATKKEEVPYTEKSKEEIFTKTIHDFEGMYVENLDDQEDTNFLVYAEGVKEIAISPIINTLLDTDYENLTYTFTNANDTLRNLKRGDVLYAKATENSPDVVAAKVKKVDVQGEQVIVYSDEISLGDLFVYADVCMNVPMETEEVALTHAYPDEVLSTQTLPVGLEDRSVQLNKLATTTFTPNLPLKHSLNIQRGLGAKGDKGAVSVTGNLSYTLKTVTLEFRFSDEHMQLYSGVWYEYNVNNNVTLSVSGNAIDYSAPLRDIPLRVSFLKVTIKPKVKVKLSGSVSGSINHIEAARNGFTATVSLAGVERKPVNDTIFPAITTGKLTDLEGSFSIGLETREEIRLGFIGIVYGSVYAGLETTGAVELLKAETKEENLDSLHACTRCVDGDISAPIRISCGLDVKFDFRRSKGKISDALKETLKAERKTLEKHSLEATLLEANIKLKDFYLSFPMEPEGEPQFGWGECPNIRYRTTVTVTTEDGNPVPNVAVKDDFSDDWQEEVTTNEDGVAVIYLPNGDNLLKAKLDGKRGSAALTIDRAPAEAEITLRTPKLYILENYHGAVYSDPENPVSNRDFTSAAFPELSSFLRSRYPNASFIEKDIIENSYAWPEIYEGDIVASFYTSCILNQPYQDGLYAATPFENLTMNIQVETGYGLEMLGYMTKEIKLSWGRSTDDSSSLYVFHGADVYTKYVDYYNGSQNSHSEPSSLRYTYMLDFINDKAGIHQMTVGFAKEMCQHLDASIEKLWE